MPDDKEKNFSPLHQLFIAHITPTTLKLQTPLMRATTAFSETLRNALLISQKHPVDIDKAEQVFQNALTQRDSLLDNEQIKKDPKLQDYLNRVIVTTEDGAISSLQATWDRHITAYSEKKETIPIPNMPENFSDIHAQFWDYIDGAQDTLRTDTQRKIEEFSRLLGTSIAKNSNGSTEEAIQIFMQSQEMRDTLLEDPRITQNKQLTHYLSNVMANVASGDASVSLRTTMKWHSDAGALAYKEDMTDPLHNCVETVDPDKMQAPLFNDEEWDTFTAPSDSNILDFPER